MKAAGLGQCSLDYLTLVGKYPKEDTKEEVIELSVQGGGPAATALVALSRLGVKTYFMGIVSDDDAGLEIRRGLNGEGVDVKWLKVRKGGESQAAFIMVNKRNGSRTICWRRPTVPPLSPKDVSAAFLEGKDFLLLDGLMYEASLKAARIAKKLKIPVMLDAGRLRDGMLELASLSDYIVASGEFASGLGLSPKDALKKLSSFGPKAATITLGKKGNVTWAEGKTFSLPAFKVETVDTTGAGDVFHGGYIFGILSGWGIKKTVGFASAFAALKCRKLGGRAGIPDLKETLRFMEGGG